MEIDDKFKLNVQFDTYLERVGLNRKTMSRVQYQETKRAFMGASGQILMLLQNDIAELEEMKAIIVLKNMTDQVQEYFKKEVEG